MASPEYYGYINSKKWKDKSSFYRKLTGGRCVVMPWLPATDSHHLTYDNLQSEVYIRDCVPLSKFVHRELIHKHPFWLSCWKDIHGRRRWMNLVLRFLTLIYTIAAIVWVPIYYPLILPTWKLFKSALPKRISKPKLKRRKSA